LNKHGHHGSGDAHPRHTLEHEHDEVVCGKDCTGWIMEWYKWAYSTGENVFRFQPDNPSFAPETRGQKINLERSEEGIWFLAYPMYNYTSTGTVIRYVNLPPGILHFLVPVYNCHPSTELHPSIQDDHDLFQIAKDDVDKVYYLEMNLDGFNLGGCRVPIEESFPVTLGRNNIFGVNSGPTRFVSDGYWVFLNELKPGDHILRLKGYSTVYKLDVEFHLGVTGPGGPTRRPYPKK
jgi:hypothetical protein